MSQSRFYAFDRLLTLSSQEFHFLNTCLKHGYFALLGIDFERYVKGWIDHDGVHLEWQ